MSSRKPVETPDLDREPRRPRCWRRKLLISVVVTLVLLELGLRFLLFDGSGLARSWGANLRDPGNFAYRWPTAWTSKPSCAA